MQKWFNWFPGSLGAIGTAAGLYANAPAIAERLSDDANNVLKLLVAAFPWLSLGVIVFASAIFVQRAWPFLSSLVLEHVWDRTGRRQFRQLASQIMECRLALRTIVSKSRSGREEPTIEDSTRARDHLYGLIRELVKLHIGEHRHVSALGNMNIMAWDAYLSKLYALAVQGDVKRARRLPITVDEEKHEHTLQAPTEETPRFG